MSHTQKCDFALTVKFVFFLVRGFEDAYAMIFSTEDVEAKRVDQKRCSYRNIGNSYGLKRICQ